MAFFVGNDGFLQERYTYDVFGQPKITDATGNVVRSFSYWSHDFLFQGREYIRELGIYDYRHRFYHPVLGRFIQTDPIGFDAGDMNLYRYCHNNPINHSDPTGLYAVRSGLTPEEKKQVEQAQREMADKLDKGATAIEWGIVSGKDSDAFKAV